MRRFYHGLSPQPSGHHRGSIDVERVMLAATMPVAPPPRPKRRSPWLSALIGIAIFSAALTIVVQGVFLGISYLAPAATKAADSQFGDQWLKTSVALLELHKLRYGRYPDSLADLKFTGAWDQGALQNVRYYPNVSRTAYYIEVQRGWMGKPDLKLPDEFWRGTGYSEALKPKN
jgi:hypothetical protein